MLILFAPGIPRKRFFTEIADTTHRVRPFRGQRGSSHASEVHVPWNRTRLGVAFGTARDVGKRRDPIAGANRHNAAAASTCQTA